MMREPFLRTLTRNTVIAAVVGVPLVLRFPGRAGFGWGYLDAFTLGFCFAFFGHYVEVGLRALPGIEDGAGRLVRIAGWFAGGLWCYVVGRWLWVLYGRDIRQLPGLVWGGVFLVALELALHYVLKLEGRPNFYEGRGDA